MKKAKVKMNQSIYLRMPILDISKTLLHVFWYDSVKQRYQDRVKLCYMNTNTFVIYIKHEHFYKGIRNDVEKWFGTSYYDEDDERLLPIGKNKKKNVFFEDESGRKINKIFVGHKVKTWACLMNDDGEHKKPKGTKKSVIKRGLMLKNYTDCLFNNKILLKSQQRFKSDDHNVYPQQINRTALSSNDEKRLQTSDKTTTYPYAMEQYI